MKIVTVITDGAIYRYGYSTGEQANAKALEFVKRPGVWKVFIDDLHKLADFIKTDVFKAVR